MKNNAIILGGNSLNSGVIDVLRSMGLNTIVVDYRENIGLQCDKHIIFDAKNTDVVKELRRENINNIKVVYTSMDNAGLAQRAICKEYGLLYAPQEAMINAHYKNKMHEVWDKAGLLNRLSISLKELDLEQIKKINSKYKIIIKPSDSCASRGITILNQNSSDDKIISAFNKAHEETTNEFVNIEEFIEGTEYTVEMLGDNFGNVSVFGISKKYHTGSAGNNKVAIKLHYNPSDVSDEVLKNIANYGIRCYKALGLKNSLGHLEILMKSNGEFSPVEIGARSSGFIASHLAQTGTHKIFLEEYMNVLNGAEVQNGYLQHDCTSAMYYFYDFPENSEAKNDLNIMNYLSKKIQSLYNDRQNLKSGKKFLRLTQDTDRYGFEILTGPKDVLTIDEINRAEKDFLRDFLK